MIKAKFIKNQRGGIEFLVLTLVVLGAFIITGANLQFKKTKPDLTPVNIDTTVKNNASQKTLQLNTLGASKQTPGPVSIGNTCPHDSGIAINSGKPYDPNNSCTCPAYVMECKDKKCVNAYQQGKLSTCTPMINEWCKNPTLAPTDGIFCVGKPVIYLYPKKDTLVNVKLNIPGDITESIPLYPAGGWNNVLAHPNGTLEYLGKTYSELYYESTVDKVNPPQKGIVVEKNKLEEELKTLTFKLGLIDKEQQEFLDYWLPRLRELNSPYVFVSVIEPQEKERIDGVSIIPAPDTKIEFLVYFKGFDKKISVEPLILPVKPPQRIGFTAVEWGGTIDPTEAN